MKNKNIGKVFFGSLTVFVVWFVFVGCATSMSYKHMDSDLPVEKHSYLILDRYLSLSEINGKSLGFFTTKKGSRFVQVVPSGVNTFKVDYESGNKYANGLPINEVVFYPNHFYQIKKLILGNQIFVGITDVTYADKKGLKDRRDVAISQMAEYYELVLPGKDIEFVTVNAGRFQRDEDPENVSDITQSFRMSEKPVTRSQFSAVMGYEKSEDSRSSNEANSPNDPAQNVNWEEAVVFCNKLSLIHGMDPVYSVDGIDDWQDYRYSEDDDYEWAKVQVNWDANGFRLPTEMEWMWAAMGAEDDSTKDFAGYDGSNNIDDCVWHEGNAGGTTHPVGSKEANGLGLYDMSGNVWEWCWDWKSSYPEEEQTDFTGAESGENRVLRGGSWDDGAADCSVSSRKGHNPQERVNSHGFRVVRRAEQ